MAQLSPRPPLSRRSLVIGLTLAVVLVILDQATKALILEVVMQPPRLIPLTSFFNLVITWNTGVSFGMFASDGTLGRWLLSGVALVICLGLGLWLARSQNLLITIALGAIIGGAIGNMIDRIRYGAVADFLDFHLMGYHWPAFNVADSAIFLGAVGLIVDALFSRREFRNIPDDHTDAG